MIMIIIGYLKIEKKSERGIFCIDDSAEYVR